MQCDQHCRISLPRHFRKMKSFPQMCFLKWIAIFPSHFEVKGVQASFGTARDPPLPPEFSPPPALWINGIRDIAPSLIKSSSTVPSRF